MSSGPTKTEIEAVFNRLRSQATNKACFDCGAKNPTWSSITYGVFICIDCSAVHRGLGVHLTFVRSTNLDTNWTWLQLRQMQLGGNAKASQFFRQHNCNTTDANQKYTSRAAQLYRDKILATAQQAMKTHGTKLHLDQQPEKPENEVNKQDEDFFAECANDNQDIFNLKNNNSDDASTKKVEISTKLNSLSTDLSEGAPCVDFLNSVVTDDAPKSTIGVRKIPPKKSGMGARKGGLGATKVKTNFADIEQRANQADQLKETVPDRKLTEEEEMETVASVRLAYQDLSLKKSQEEEKLKSIDPIKAQQLERLGMGFNVKGGVSHSAISDMQTISQEHATRHSGKSFDRDISNNDFFDEYSTPMYSSIKQDKDLLMMGFETIEPIEPHHSNITTMFTPTQSSKSNAANGGASYNKRSNKTTTRDIKVYENDAAQKKFGSAKGISSDQFFGTEQSTEDRSANLARFQGSNSISSSDFFGDGTANNTPHRGYRTSVQLNTPDLEDIKDGVRRGVTKVAGRISSMANDVMSSLQDKYGY